MMVMGKDDYDKTCWQLCFGKNPLQVFWGNGGVCPDGVCPLVKLKKLVFPKQRKLMGSSAQNRSGGHWCRRRVRFNEGSVEGSRKPWCKAKSSSTGFRRRFRRRSGTLWCSQVRFNRVPEKVPVLGFAARFRKIRKHKTLRLLGIPTKLIGITVPGLWLILWIIFTPQ